jgi:hypothetical protein
MLKPRRSSPWDSIGSSCIRQPYFDRVSLGRPPEVHSRAYVDDFCPGRPPYFEWRKLWT